MFLNLVHCSALLERRKPWAANAAADDPDDGAVGERADLAEYHARRALLDDEAQQKEAMALFDQWAALEYEDALSLLGHKFCANEHYRDDLAGKSKLKKVYKKIRSKAIKCLKEQSTDTIKSIML